MTSASAPEYLSPERIHPMNRRAKDETLFACAHPAPSIRRCRREARSPHYRPGVQEKYLYGNASRLFSFEPCPYRCGVPGGC